jgi:1,4-dihydroxy-2-naphthoyl-CoA hydrolase
MNPPPEAFGELTASDFNAVGEGQLPGLLGVEIVEVGGGRVVARLEIRPHHNAPNGYLHAATVVALADTACGYGCVANFPSGVTGFTTVEAAAIRSVRPTVRGRLRRRCIS